MTAGTILSVAPAMAEVRLIPGMDLELAYTDNVSGAPRGLEDGDYYSILTPSMTVNANGGRGQGSLRYGLEYTEYSDRGDLSSESHNLLGTGQLEVWRDRVFVDMQAAMSRQTIARNGAVAANDRNLGTNQTEVFNYQTGVTKTTRHEGWVISDARLSLSQSLTDPLGNNAGATGVTSDTTTYIASHVLSSGPRFTRLQWNITTSFDETKVKNGDEVAELVARADGEYPVNRFVAVTASAGYEELDAGNRADSSDGPTWTVGGRFTPGPRTSLRIEYGKRFDDDFYEGDFSYQISPTLGVTASFRQDVALQQTRINDAFNNLAIDANGDFIDDRTGLPFSPNGANDDLSEINNVSRTRNFNISMAGTRGRNTYGSALSWNSSKTRAQSRVQSTRAANVNFGRALSPKTNLALNAGWVGTSDNSTAGTTTVNASATLDYRIATSVVGAATMSHLRRDSSNPASDLDENTLSARLQIIF